VTGRLLASVRTIAGRHRSLATDTAYVLLVQLLSRGVFNLATILAANIFTVAVFSGYNYFLISINLLGALLSMGLPVAATRAGALATDASVAQRADRAAALAWLFAAVLVAALLLGPVLIPLLEADEVRVAPAMLLFGAGAFALCGVSQSFLQGAGAFRSTLGPVLVGSAALAGGAGWAWVTRSEHPLILGTVLFYLLPALLYLHRLSRSGLLGGRAAVRRPSGNRVRETIGVALPSLGNAIIFTGVNWWLARSVIEHAATPSAFPEFVIGMQWFSLALFLPLGLGQAIFPRYLRMAARDELARAAVVRLAVGALLLGLTVAACGAALTPLLSLVYGRYEFSAAFVATVLSAAALSAPANLLGQSIIAARGAAAWLRTYSTYLLLGVTLPVLAPPHTAFEAAVILCALNGAVLIAAAITIYAGGRRLRPG
jgi:O-antigen/teichoic acid export membrane protein